MKTMNSNTLIWLLILVGAAILDLPLARFVLLLLLLAPTLQVLSIGVSVAGMALCFLLCALPLFWLF